VRRTAALREAIEEVLGVLPRAGSSGTFTAEQIAQILVPATLARFSAISLPFSPSDEKNAQPLKLRFASLD